MQNRGEIDRNTVVQLLTDDSISHRKKSWKLLNAEQIEIIRDKYFQPKCTIPIVPSGYNSQTSHPFHTPGHSNFNHLVHAGNNQNRIVLKCQQVADVLLRNPIIHKILTIGDGCISLCGGSLLTYLTTIGSRPFDIGPRPFDIDYDFFFHSCSPDEATTKLKSCVEAILLYCHEKLIDTKIRRTQQCLTLIANNVEYQFILRLYKSPDQILGGFDLWASKIGFDIKRGVFATVQGAFTLACGYQPIDLTKRSKSYGHRLVKYNRSKKIGILLMGLNSRPDDFETPDLFFGMTRADFYHVDATRQYSQDYDEGSTYMNFHHLRQNQIEAITFAYGYDFSKLGDVLDIDRRSVEQSLFANHVFESPFRRSYTIDPKVVNTFFDTPEKILTFKHAYYMEDDIVKSTELWNAMVQSYVDKMFEVGKQINEPERMWKVVDPGEQGFGSNNPAIMNPREWYGQHYSPCKIGLADEVWRELRLCRRENPLWKKLPKDMFRLICQTIRQLEIDDVMAKLLGPSPKRFVRK